MAVGSSLSGSISLLIDALGVTSDGGTRAIYATSITSFSLSPAFPHDEGAHNSGSITVDNNHPNDAIPSQVRARFQAAGAHLVTLCAHLAGTIVTSSQEGDDEE